MKREISLHALVIFMLVVGVAVQAKAQTDKYPEMVLVEGGTFQMGSIDGEDDERPIHSVTVADFYMGKYEITVAQYQIFCDATGTVMPQPPKWGYLAKHPLVNVNYPQAIAYCKWLSNETGEEYRLPTEAEWEFAAKGGKLSKGYADGKYYKYSGSSFVEEVAWYKADETTKQVGQGDTETKYMPNELGIYDMSGNVWEWCSDFYDETYYEVSPTADPKGPIRGNYRVQRGGSWANEPHKIRITYRVANVPENAGFTDGFRVVKTAKKK
ncbi:MAG TPA: hypothetical protein DCQ31_11765 [Bacteroidales bacterium]|nr:hypothetical protein [Bacteroidales bacterium]